MMYCHLLVQRTFYLDKGDPPYLFLTMDVINICLIELYLLKMAQVHKWEKCNFFHEYGPQIMFVSLSLAGPNIIRHI